MIDFGDDRSPDHIYHTHPASPTMEGVVPFDRNVLDRDVYDRYDLSPHGFGRSRDNTEWHQTIVSRHTIFYQICGRLSIVFCFVSAYNRKKLKLLIQLPVSDGVFHVEFRSLPSRQ